MSVKTGVAFASWLQTNHPTLYAKAVKAANTATNQRAGLGEATETAEAKTGWFDSFLKSAASLGTTYLTLKNQRDVLQANIERAKIGQPPIELQTQPTLNTQVSVAPDVVDKIAASASGNVNKMLMFGAAALAAVLLLKK